MKKLLSFLCLSRYFLLTLFILLLFTSCSDDDTEKVDYSKVFSTESGDSSDSGESTINSSDENSLDLAQNNNEADESDAKAPLLFEEDLEQSDQSNQIKFALEQVLQRLNLPFGNMVPRLSEIRVSKGIYYTFSDIDLYTGDSIPLFISTLRNSMIAWADDIKLIPDNNPTSLDLERFDSWEKAEVWSVIQDDIETHRLYLHFGYPTSWLGANDNATTPEKTGTAPPKGTDSPSKSDSSTAKLNSKQTKPNSKQTKPSETVGLPNNNAGTTVAMTSSMRPNRANPKMVVVIDDLGESIKHAKRLINLNFPVTFAIWPYSSHGVQVANMAHLSGKEIILHQPMEPVGYPKVNPGKGAILRGMSASQVRSILNTNLSRIPHVTGINNHMGSSATQDYAIVNIVANELASRNLLALDSLTHGRSRFGAAATAHGLKAYKRDVFLDVTITKSAVLSQLRKAEHIARSTGQAVVIGHPYPATLQALEEWQRTRDKSIKIVKLSNLTPLGLKQ